MTKTTRLLDGCHRYGWLINTALTVAMFFYFMGDLNSTVRELQDRMTRVERVLDQLLLK